MLVIIRHLFRRVRQNPQPLRFLISRLLWHTRACRYFIIDRGSYRLRFHPSSLSAEYWLNPNERVEDEELLAALLPDGGTFVDVGANVGALTLAASSLVGGAGCVYSFEPHPRIYGFLRANVELNQAGNVRVENVAVGDRDGEAIFSSKRSDDQNRIVSGGGISIPARRLDALLAGVPGRVDVLKIDVEGYEVFVVEGAPETLRRTSFVVFESWEQHAAQFGYSTADVLRKLRGAGFRIFREARGALLELPGDHVSTSCENLVATRDVDDLKERMQPVGRNVVELDGASDQDLTVRSP